MNSIKKWIRDIFGFSGNEINGFLILIPLMLLLIFSEPIYSALVANQARHYERDTKKLDSLVAVWNIHVAETETTPLDKSDSLFSFDPNTTSVEQLRSLGFSPASANRIAAYRLKGGVFRIKADLMKIYGLDSALYKQLYPFIQLPSERLVRSSDRGKPLQRLKFEPFGKKEVKKTFDINTADTILLKGVYGIGSKLAARIVKFRDRLGGFIKPEQLNEVYGLDSMVINRLLKMSFIKEGFIPMKINVNKANEKQLSGHPYIRYKIARALVTYRFQHGDFMDASDIKKLTMIKPEEVERLLPYIKVND
jgi:competence protein ComEA